LALNIHSNFSLKNKSIDNFAMLLISIFPHVKKLHRIKLLQIWCRTS
jgi:hypothetical protein